MTSDPYGLQASGLPPELAADHRRLTRQQAIAQAMMQQAMQPLGGARSTGRLMVAPHWLEGAAKLAQTYAAKTQMDQSDRGFADLGKRYQDMMADEVRRYVSAGQGTPASAETIVDEQANGGEGAVATINAPAVPPTDARARISQAMVSQNQMLRALGAKDYEALIKSAPNSMLGKIDPKDYTPESFAQFMQTGNPAVLKPRVKMEAGPDGVYRDPYSVAPNTVAADPNKPFAPSPTGGAPIPNLPFQQFSKDNRAAGAPRVDVNTADNPFLRGLGEASAKAFETGATQARGALDTINTVHQIRSAIDTSGIQLGPTTKLGLLLSRIGEKFVGATASEQEKLGKARQIIQGQAQLELDAAKQMKGQGQITEAEREIIRRASSGDVDNMSNSEMRSLLDALEKVSRIKIKSHTAQIDGLRKQKNISPMVLSPFDVEMPPEYKAPQPAGTSVISPETQQLLDRFAPVGP